MEFSLEMNRISSLQFDPQKWQFLGPNTLRSESTGENLGEKKHICHMTSAEIWALQDSK